MPVKLVLSYAVHAIQEAYILETNFKIHLHNQY